MIQEMNRLNNKVERLQKNQKKGGYVDGVFPGQNDCYPCLSTFSFDYWQKTWHAERGIEYYKSDGFWLSTQTFTSTVLAKDVGKIFLDFEYYTYVENIFVHIDEVEEDDVVYIAINGETVTQVVLNAAITEIDFNKLLLLNDYVTVYLNDNKSALVQIKYRLVG